MFKKNWVIALLSIILVFGVILGLFWRARVRHAPPEEASRSRHTAGPAVPKYDARAVQGVFLEFAGSLDTRMLFEDVRALAGRADEAARTPGIPHSDKALMAAVSMLSRMRVGEFSKSLREIYAWREVNAGIRYSRPGEIGSPNRYDADAYLLYMLARVHERRGETSRAAGYYRELIQAGPGPEIYTGEPGPAGGPAAVLSRIRLAGLYAKRLNLPAAAARELIIAAQSQVVLDGEEGPEPAAEICAARLLAFPGAPELADAALKLIPQVSKDKAPELLEYATRGFAAAGRVDNAVATLLKLENSYPRFIIPAATDTGKARWPAYDALKSLQASALAPEVALAAAKKLMAGCHGPLQLFVRVWYGKLLATAGRDAAAAMAVLDPVKTPAEDMTDFVEAAGMDPMHEAGRLLDTMKTNP